MTHESVTKISALRRVLIFEPPLNRDQQSAIAVAGAYDLVPKATELDTLHTSAFYCDKVDSLTVAGRVVAALRASGFEAEITNPGVPGQREVVKNFADTQDYI
jgi:hypothetical protein